jgi:hypothetical protein
MFDMILIIIITRIDQYLNNNNDNKNFVPNFYINGNNSFVFILFMRRLIEKHII